MSDAPKQQLSRQEKLSRSLADSLYVKQEWEGRSIDPLLQSVVHNTNIYQSNEHEITLTVGGNLISGILISGNAFMDLWADEFAAVFTKENGVADQVRDLYLNWRVDPDELLRDPQPPQFIHLKAAEIYSTNGRPILAGGSLWRGKLSGVDGFNLGRLVFNL
ncbi:MULTISPECIES: gas vesicle protein [Pseudomonas]|uniref:gas vesicle protein n=1 Tax=Pseudomonas TaxID=286 RepID=UPI002234C78B|nr:gas vesicle protein [Pseudomonas sp. B21-059]UZE36906.1 gas vesicle protein [Pseudomonas sp. B21-059]